MTAVLAIIVLIPVIVALELAGFRYLDIKIVPLIRERWTTRKTRMAMADALAQIRAEERLRLLAKRNQALRLIAASSGALRRDH